MSSTSIWANILLIPLNTLINPLLMMMTSSIFFMWLIIEINTFIFIFLIIFNNDKMKSLMNYFIVQAFTSLFLIYSVMMNLDLNTPVLNDMNNIAINLSLWMKLGMPPFHSWFTNIMKNSSWLSCFLLTTPQKLPVLIMWNSLINVKMILLLIVLSSTISLINMFNLTNFKLIMAFSSIIHSSWMLMNMCINFKMMMFYYISYFFINMICMQMFNEWKINYYIDLYNVSLKNFFYLSITFLSLGGLPPFTGFLMKWFSINNLLEFNMMILIILIYSSILSIYFYINMSLPGFMLFHMNKKKMINFSFEHYNRIFGFILYMMTYGGFMFLFYMFFE